MSIRGLNLSGNFEHERFGNALELAEVIQIEGGGAVLFGDLFEEGFGGGEVAGFAGVKGLLEDRFGGRKDQGDFVDGGGLRSAAQNELAEVTGGNGFFRKLGVRGAGDEDVGAQWFVEGFETRGEIGGGANDGVIEPKEGTQVSSEGFAAIDADPGS